MTLANRHLADHMPGHAPRRDVSGPYLLPQRQLGGGAQDRPADGGSSTPPQRAAVRHNTNTAVTSRRRARSTTTSRGRLITKASTVKVKC